MLSVRSRLIHVNRAAARTRLERFLNSETAAVPVLVADSGYARLGNRNWVLAMMP
jgi:hypothetical protein